MKLWEEELLRVKRMREEEARKSRTKQTAEMMDFLLETLERDRASLEGMCREMNPMYVDYFKLKDLLMEVRMAYLVATDNCRVDLGYVRDYDHCFIDVFSQTFVRFGLDYIGKKLHRNDEELLELIVGWMSRHVPKKKIDVVKEFTPYYEKDNWLKDKGSLLMVVVYGFVMGARLEYCHLTKQETSDRVDVQEPKFIWIFLNYMRGNMYLDEQSYILHQLANTFV